MGTFVAYRKAAERIARGRWTRNTYDDGRGNQCLVQSVLTAQGVRGTLMPEEMVDELDRELSQHWWYRQFRAQALYKGEPLQRAIERWNDLFWRRPSQVVKVLEATANTTEIVWLRVERLRLIGEVGRLQGEIEPLKERVEALEAENRSLWRRLLDARALKADRNTLDLLDKELDDAMAQLEQLETAGASV